MFLSLLNEAGKRFEMPLLILVLILQLCRVFTARDRMILPAAFSLEFVGRRSCCKVL
jgi:hypothetical protein